MNWLTGLLNTFGPRLLGVAASGLAGLIVVKTKGIVQIDPTTLVEVGMGMIGGYAATHRAVTAVSNNPGDAATNRVAEGENSAANDPRSGSTVVIPPKE